jgi:hypothetical protein
MTEGEVADSYAKPGAGGGGASTIQTEVVVEELGTVIVSETSRGFRLPF